jgi:hypothetical protein
MSSHHFVKEGQEPALLILDALTYDVAGPLLEWAPLVVVVQPALEDVLLWNIKIDAVLAEDMNVQRLGSMLANQAPLTILTYRAEESPLINALSFLIRRKQYAVNIFSANAIETISIVKKFADQIQINVMDGTFKWSAITSGHFEKWMAARTIVFLREGMRQQSISLKGLKKVDDHYESLADGMVSLESGWMFWVGSLTS